MILLCEKCFDGKDCEILSVGIGFFPCESCGAKNEDIQVHAYRNDYRKQDVDKINIQDGKRE